MSNITKISKATATAVFVELGFKSATGWDADRLNAKLAKLGDHVDGTEELADPAAAKGLKTILAAFKAGSTVEVAAEEPVAEPAAKATKPAKPAKPAKEEPVAEPAAKPAKASKAKPVAAEDDKPAEKPAKGKAKPAPEPAAKATKPAKPAKPAKEDDEDEDDEGIAKDKFGNREGTGLAKINANLSKKLATLDELVEATGIRKGRVRRHLRKLVAKGLIEKVEGKGFRMVTKAAE